MFYSQFILAKKGPLGTIWIAAHLERKLRKNQVADTDIGVSVDSILFPDVPIALRLSSHLLLGVVRIYNKKVNYLFDDCSETLLKIKQAFRSAAVDLPPEESKAPYHSITLPETFDLDDFELPDNDIFQGKDHHISSREQITLQDTMEGVTYSTSKFGLDERFGDGDASGLDLDEELFLDKMGTSGLANERSDPQASVEPMTPLKQDEHPETRAGNSGTRVDGVDDYADLMDYAQAPCTPGLVEEPNLSNVQEVSACDDHLESEYHLGESTMTENAKRDIYGDKQEDNWSSHNNTNYDAIPMGLTEDGHRSDGLYINISKPQGECPTEVNMEHVLTESTSGSKLPSDLLSQDKPLNHASELADKIRGASEASGTEDLQNGAASKGNNSSVLVDEPSDYHQILDKTGLEKSACENSGLTSPSHRDGSFPQNAEIQACDKAADPNSLNLDVHEEVVSSETLFLRQCNSNVEQPDLTSGCVMPTDAAVQSDVTASTSGREETVNIGKGCSGTENSEEILKENHIQEHTLQEDNHAVPHEPDSQATNVSAKEILKENHIQEHKLQEDNHAVPHEPESQAMNVSAHDSLVENPNNSAEADLPAPEKLLSVREDLVDQHKNMLAEVSPGVLGGPDEGDAGSKIVSGKKRSFTESTLTEQSLNSVESSRLVRFKRTIESVPDDDDLLSSILVGRSSVLKVKPTPRLSEVTSSKRTRSAPRTGAPKRKVLMDDAMVLHGDTIRQQLTNTEDIRRIRKKAPCTRPEISLIQKQYLEDDVFLEPLFNGMSTELVSLHSQMCDLSGITVCNNDNLTGASLEIDSDLRVPSENVPYEHGKDVSFETMAEPMLSSNDVKNDGSPTTATPHLTSQNFENGESLDVGSDKVSGKPNDAEQGGVSITNLPLLDGDSEVPKSSESPLLSNNRMDEVDEINVQINTCKEQTKLNSDVEADLPQLDATEVETNNKNDDASGPSAGVIQTNPITETSETNTSAKVEAPAGPTDQAKNAHSVESDSVFMDVDNGQAITTDEQTTKDDNINAVVDTETLVRDDFLSEVAHDSASLELLSNSKLGQLEYDGRIEIDTAIFGGNIVDSSFPAQVGLQEDGFMANGGNPEQDCFMDNGGNPEHPDAYERYMMEADGSFIDLHDREELQYSAAGNDTDFLNVDDDDLTEIADDHIPDDEEARFIENTGWSSRTRAVSKYLQTLFDKEAECGRKSLSLDNLLVGKSRKEASRMFFETLVLKTRDYVHVEQQNPFNDITLKPRTRLC